MPASLLGWSVGSRELLPIAASGTEDQNRMFHRLVRIRGGMHGLVLRTLGGVAVETDQILYSGSSPTWIAKRVLTDPEGGPALEVNLGIPTYVEADDCWECPFMLADDGQPAKIYAGSGVDAFQALIQAQEGIRVALAESGRTLSWLNMEPGLTGFTRVVPITFGLGLVRHLETLVESEVDRWSTELVAAMQKRAHDPP